MSTGKPGSNHGGALLPVFTCSVYSIKTSFLLTCATPCLAFVKKIVWLKVLQNYYFIIANFYEGKYVSNLHFHKSYQKQVC